MRRTGGADSPGVRPRLAVALALVSGVTGLAAPGAAAALRPQPLVDIAPLSTAFTDRIGHFGHAGLRQAGASPTIA
jgi:hypothetical protein